MSSETLEISVERAKELLGDGSTVFVDVREQSEWDQSRMPGDVRHLPVGLTDGHMDDFDRDKLIVFVCRVGGRSLIAAEAFANAGFDAVSMAGGLIEWNEKGFALEPAGAGVA